jgi:hypothetical protein
MKLNMGEIGDLITALDCALKSVEVLIRSELPPGGPRSRWWKPQDREDYRIWTNDLKVFRRLRRKLTRVEAAAIAAHQFVAPKPAISRPGTRPSRSRRAPTPADFT